jgi:DNA-binding transcriptional regulator YdaS (Cro superfamily)
MKLNEYLASNRGEAVRLAHAIGCTSVFLRNAAHGHRNVSETIALAIERETNGAVTVDDLRPGFREHMASAGYVKQAEKAEA